MSVQLCDTLRVLRQIALLFKNSLSALVKHGLMTQYLLLCKGLHSKYQILQGPCVFLYRHTHDKVSILKFSFIIIVMCMHVPQPMCGGQRATLCTQFSPFVFIQVP